MIQFFRAHWRPPMPWQALIALATLFTALLQEPDILAGNYSIHWLERWLARHYA